MLPGFRWSSSDARNERRVSRPGNPACGREPQIVLRGLDTRLASRAATLPPKWGAGRVEQARSPGLDTRLASRAATLRDRLVPRPPQGIARPPARGRDGRIPVNAPRSRGEGCARLRTPFVRPRWRQPWGDPQDHTHRIEIRCIPTNAYPRGHSGDFHSNSAAEP
jgi:hypothetical protein